MRCSVNNRSAAATVSSRGAGARPCDPAACICPYPRSEWAGDRAHGPMLLSGDCGMAVDGAVANDVQLADGPLCRIYEEGGAWFLEGVYD